HVRTGTVRTISGNVLPRATVVLLPETGAMPLALEPNLALRDPLDEVCTRTDIRGQFRIAAPDSGYRLVVLSSFGFALSPLPKSSEPVEITLQPRAAIRLSSQGGTPQKTDI